MGNNRGNGLIGILFFLLIVVGPSISGPIANALSQATGMNIDRSAVMIGLVVLAVLASVVNSLVRRSTRSSGPGAPRMPTPGTPTAPRMPPSLPPPGPTPRIPTPPTSARMPPPNLPTGSSPLPGPPRFEPIVNPRVLLFGVLGVIVFGGFFLVLLFVSGVF